jgi:RNA polymerase sigma-70 factor (ECF subfamily)
MSLDLFTQRILPLKDKLFRFAYHLLGQEAEAEDAVQEVLLKVWTKRDEWGSWQNIEGYCMVALRNHCLERLRQKRPQLAAEAAAREVRSKDRDPAQQVQDKELSGHIRRCMEGLPEKLQSVVHLREVEGLSYQEIASVLDLSMEQVKVNLFRARTALKQLINRE